MTLVVIAFLGTACVSGLITWLMIRADDRESGYNPRPKRRRYYR